MTFVTLDDENELALVADCIIGCCKHPQDSDMTIILTDHGNFSTSLKPAEVRARVEAALKLGTH
jgi:hypothetical protein